MLVVDIINKKRKGEVLSKEEIEYFINGFSNGEIQDYQASALLMAICINKMTIEETTNLTMAMAYSSKVLNFSGMFETPVIDKHSTGGVGDKVTLIVLPIVASLGVKSFKLSGKGLGATGGTIDKLCSIKGYNTNISINQAIKFLKKNGVCLISQTDDIAVSDKKLYALRDVTGTVESVHLIAASVMSKKIAAGAEKIVLEVTYGTGALIKSKEDAKVLAQMMVEIGKKVNIETVALITNMDEPLGENVGNSLEIMEVINFLNSKEEELNKSSINSLKKVVFEVASHMLKLSGLGENDQENEMKIMDAITSGKAYEKFIQMIKGQGGCIKEKQIEEFNKKIESPVLVKSAKYTKEILADAKGYINYVDASKIGEALITLGGGRKKKDDKIDYAVGFIFHKKMGDEVKKGESIVTIYFNDKNKIDECIKYILEAIKLDLKKIIAKKHIDDII